MPDAEVEVLLGGRADPHEPVFGARQHRRRGARARVERAGQIPALLNTPSTASNATR
ncbi:hypothetical protein JOF29_007022 [Kribbella aluminosa]|uniref:Uncharacterized protein n=1 Tax=Kribbella aluminosa TaxID=416017 RepID=A0ABS4UW92_9ACTN|nr:hypothetical protein [Kribbella aluminosa]MBP2355912.1 hypothetical protein [Kribbella aluminosa]